MADFLPRNSRQDYANLPAAVIFDFLGVGVPLWAVTEMTLTSEYHLPATGTTVARNIAPVKDDTIVIKGLLVGKLRYAFKFALETMFDVAKRGSGISALSGGYLSGLFLLTTMTLRTDMQVEKVEFKAEVDKRETIAVTITMKHLPVPGSLPWLLDGVNALVMSLVDWRVGIGN